MNGHAKKKVDDSPSLLSYIPRHCSCNRCVGAEWAGVPRIAWTHVVETSSRPSGALR